jgi:hypothetical protein
MLRSDAGHSCATDFASLVKEALVWRLTIPQLAELSVYWVNPAAEEMDFSADRSGLAKSMQSFFYSILRRFGLLTS